MKVTSVSSYVMTTHQTSIRSKMQYDSVATGYEATMGEFYDKSLALGNNSNRFIDNNNAINRLTSMKSSNNLVAQRMKIMQSAMDSLIFAGDDTTPAGALVQFNNDLLSDPLITSPKTIQSSAQNALDSLVSALNSNYNGEYVFGGSNVSQQPMQYYEAGSGEGASAVVQQAFEDKFGFSINDPEVANISSDEFNDFLNNEFNALFEDPSYGENFSKANDGVLTNRISSNGEDVNISVSANEDGFRNAMKNLVMVAEFGNIGLNSETQTALSVAARESNAGDSIGGAITDIISISASLGNSEQRVAKANQRIEIQLGIYDNVRKDLVSVDQQEAAAKFTALESMMLVSTSITQKLMQMSLVNYLQ